MDNQAFPFPAPNLPLLLPAETLYSWCGHVHLWNGNGSVLQTSRQLFKNPYAALLHDFPAHLHQLTTSIGDQIGSAEQLALKHTLLGYYLPLVDAELSRFILDSVCQKSYPQLKFKLGIPASRIGCFHPLKYCPDCIRDDAQQHGRSYWHLYHQFPSVFVCRRHERPLVFIEPRATPVHQRKWLFPGINNEPNLSPQIEDRYLERFLSLSALSFSLATMSPGSLSPKILAYTYQNQFKERGFLTSQGSLRVRLLNGWIKSESQYLESLHGLSFLHSLESPSGGFAASISRKQPRRGHPLKHLLLISLLFRSWDSFIKQYQRMQEDTPSWLLPNEQPQQMNEDPRGSLFLRLLKKEHLSITKAAEKAGISTTTGTQWAKRHKISYTQRTKTLNPTLLHEVRNKLKRGLPKKHIVATAPISLASLNRLLAADPGLKEKWQTARFEKERVKYRSRFLRLVDENPGVPVKYIRKIPGNGYLWLYRHDREWLVGHLPSLWN